MIWSAAGFTADLAIYFACALLILLLGFEWLASMSDPKRRFRRKAQSLVSSSGTIQKVFYGAQGKHVYGKVIVDGDEYDADFDLGENQRIEVGLSVKVVDVNMEKHTLKVQLTG
jgi:membrane-bound ClpP family serine protease